MKNSRVLVAVLMVALNANAQSLRVRNVRVAQEDGFPSTISFFCNQAYDRNDCKSDVLTLRRALARYPVDRLGQWQFVLVRSDEWRDLLRALHGDPVSPAFTVLERRTTVLEQALFSASASRNAELLERFRTMGEGLLQLAISHELGHGICGELDEVRADEYGRELRNGKTVACGRSIHSSAPSAGRAR
jgi:hypothetical protein